MRHIPSLTVSLPCRAALFATLFVVGCESGSVDVADPTATGDSDPLVDTTSPGDSELAGDTDTPTKGDTDDTDTLGDTEDTDPPVDTDPPDPTPPDLTAEGPRNVSLSSGSVSLSTGCSMDYTSYLGAGAPQDIAVIVAHGFLRDRAKMADLSEHLASWGVSTWAVDLCRFSFLGTDHEQNGEDLVAFANEHLPGRDVIWVGYSAGGLAATVAGELFGGTLAVLGLDLVDSDNLAKDAAANLTVPLGGLMGEPGSCNSNGNGEDAITNAADHIAWRIPDASHCTFESPTDVGCTFACEGSLFSPGPVGGVQAEADRKDIVASMTAAWVLWRSGVDPTGQDYWLSTGTTLQGLTSSGALVTP